MICPRCRKRDDVLAYERMEEIDDFAHETNPIYKCPRKRGGCSWIFSPGDNSILASMLSGATQLRRP